MSDIWEINRGEISHFPVQIRNLMEAKTRTAKKLYEHQERDIETLFQHINGATSYSRLLYQLPTGGGKTVVFSEIAKKFIETSDQTVVVLTHRKELCTQTSTTLRSIGVKNRIISSTSSNFKPDCNCYVAMVETLKNRIRSKQINTHNIGLVIIDEAHHNSFRKLLGSFKKAFVIGVTATPFSSDIAKPMNKYYSSLVTGESISNLIADGFLASPKSFAYEVELNTLKTGIHGDYTVSSSNELYSSPAILDLLLKAYREQAQGQKTLIFNNGVETSLKVYERFKADGLPIMHLDSKTPDEERTQILQWFRKTKGAILTSVSILTTGFDEPTVQAVVLNRATTSITLYHQMIGRGSRRLPSKRTFTIIDLGNNIQRFGGWEQPLDWNYIFKNPEAFAEQLNYSRASSDYQSHVITAEMRAHFPNTLELAFDIESHYDDVVANGLKPKRVIQQSLRQQAVMCIENAATLSEALKLADVLQPEIQWRVNQYTHCINKSTKNYKEWLAEDYMKRLRRFVQKIHYLKENR